MSAKQATSDKLQGSVATDLSAFVSCTLQFARLANTLLKDEESARDIHVLACNFAEYLQI